MTRGWKRLIHAVRMGEVSLVGYGPSVSGLMVRVSRDRGNGAVRSFFVVVC
jgi:hypothetical protein